MTKPVPIISEIIGLYPEPKHLYKYSKVTPLKCADPTLIYGVELEIENAHYDEWVVPGMRVTEDGSLRNAGSEYITQPMTYSNLMHCLGRFFSKSKVTEKNYSDRCSVHVHANCLDLTVDHLSTVLLLYQVFEKVLFNYCGEERDKNIFCVPWSQTLLNHDIVTKLQTNTMNLKNWQKYTALNLLPLFSQGTIEFRHMPGTPDLTKIGNWLNMIGSMFAYARSNSYQETKDKLIALNTTSHYNKVFMEVFKEYYPEAAYYPIMQEDIEDGVINMKYSLLKTKINKNNKDFNNMILDDIELERMVINYNPVNNPLQQLQNEFIQLMRDNEVLEARPVINQERDQF